MKTLCHIVSVIWLVLVALGAMVVVTGSPVAAANSNSNQSINTVRLDWPVIPGAVSYQVAIMKAPVNIPENVVSVKRNIFVNSYELDATVFSGIKNYYWKVCPVNLQGEIMGPYSALHPIMTGTINSPAPFPLTEYDKMPVMPLYPVFAWTPYGKSVNYEIRVQRKSSQGRFQVIRELTADTNIFYEYAGYTWPGEYMWQVRGLDGQGRQTSQWSEPSYFTVEARHKVAALGDSITHGGGAVSTPPCYRMYNWETYCQVPVKNLGYSGDTVEVMLDRFDQDVLPFHPQILVIMGGVNNFREGDSGGKIVATMKKIQAKCEAHGIVPVFATATPINPHFMRNLDTISAPASNWQEERKILNNWVLKQKYHVDVAGDLTDEYGLLKDELTTDGLHPDQLGKKMIGEKISKYLLQQFPQARLLEN